VDNVTSINTMSYDMGGIIFQPQESWHQSASNRIIIIGWSVEIYFGTRLWHLSTSIVCFGVIRFEMA
jgi:hypothetical protein